MNDAKRASYRAAFEETLRRPGDAEVLLKYAQAAAAAEDYEGAITAYERFLVIDADQPRVKFELGVLYYKLKSYDAARTYFEAARTSTKSTPEIAERSSEFIRDIDRRWGTSRLTGEFVAGIRYSDNPASLPTGTLQSYGATVVPNPTFQRQGDFAFVGAASLSHRYDFGRQDNGTLETDFSFYTAKQFQVTNADVMLLDLGVGPRMELIDGPLSGVQLKPFVSGRYITVGNLPTYWAWGAGLEASVPVAEKVRAGIVVLGQRRDFVDNASVPFNSQNSGNNGTVAGNLRADLTADLEASLGGNYTRYIAMTGFQSYGEAGFGGSLTWRFVDPVGVNGRKWTLAGNAAMAFATYDQPDPFVQPNTVRTQTDVNLGLLLSVPLDDRLTLVGQTTYFQRSASINNYSFNSFSSLVGIGWRF
ncbi:tetratricopeptide repeat protein [Reyranella sp. MMS21-HV4-11]|uniref:Tetratricopeptide repeat protein n=1 Tax=Reyranella humidisoli TaxID=2849149 RepID=A0ABS6IM27_9HYPH|nr:tetratricopeptide repeat protein [Reyranella sp. MMS21-HV4-11]MBU8874278.1 tetratricopeptide repeat protein [Reyranella sp. MMS21-HV4-11]